MTLLKLLAIFVGLYLASVAAVVSIGLYPAIPWNILIFLFCLTLPVVIIVDNVSVLLDGKVGALALLAISMAIIALYQYWLLWVILLCVLVILRLSILRRRITRDAPSVKRVAGALGVFMIGYAIVWNTNYLLARFLPVLHDDQLQALDLKLLGRASYEGTFPLLHNGAANFILNNAYTMLFVAVASAIILECRKGDREVVIFLERFFSLFAIGIVSFIVYPAVGPSIAYPQSIDTSHFSPIGARLLAGMLNDYAAARNGGRISGYGFFISCPSLHVMMAVLSQWYIFTRHSRTLHWLLLPVTVLASLSTVLLGYHYIIDLPVALVIMAGLIFAWSYKSRPVLERTGQEACSPAANSR